MGLLGFVALEGRLGSGGLSSALELSRASLVASGLSFISSGPSPSASFSSSSSLSRSYSSSRLSNISARTPASTIISYNSFKPSLLAKHPGVSSFVSMSFQIAPFCNKSLTVLAAASITASFPLPSSRAPFSSFPFLSSLPPFSPSPLPPASPPVRTFGSP